MPDDFYCPTVPTHLAGRITQQQWNFINELTEELYQSYILNNPGKYRDDLKKWMIRGYWLITYFCNPSHENLEFMIQRLQEFGILRIDNNLVYLEFVEDLKQHVKSC